MWTVIKFLLFTKTGRFVLAMLIGALLIGALKLGIYYHDESVKRTALLEFNQKQMELVIQKQQEFAEHMKKLDEQGQLIMKQVGDQNTKIDGMADDIKNSLDNLNVQGKDDKISPFMEETIKQLERMERRK